MRLWRWFAGTFLTLLLAHVFQRYDWAKEWTYVPLYGVRFRDRHAWWWRQFANCSLLDPRCFNLSRCVENNATTVYLYPPDAGLDWLLQPLLDQKIKQTFDIHVREALTFASQTPSAVEWLRLVEDPADACVLVPHIYARHARTAYDSYTGWVLARLRSLPHWDGGKNHLIFDFSDGAAAAIETDAAIRARANSPKRLHRLELDIATHLVPNCNILSSWIWELRTIPNTARPLLASFMGGSSSLSGVRHRLLAVVQGSPDVAVVTCNGASQCRSEGVPSRLFHSCDMAEGGFFGPCGYEVLLRRAEFALCPAGHGLSTHRIAEAVLLGAVPVVVPADASVADDSNASNALESDDYTLHYTDEWMPFYNDLIDTSPWMVLHSASMPLNTLLPKLRALQANETAMHELRRNGQLVAQILSRAPVLAVLASVQKRVRAALGMDTIPITRIWEGSGRHLSGKQPDEQCDRFRAWKFNRDALQRGIYDGSKVTPFEK